MGFLDVVDAHAAEVIGEAEAQRQAALDAAAAGRAPRWSRRGRGPTRWPPGWPSSRPPASAVTDELDEALGDVDRQLAAAAAGAGRRQRADGGQLAGLRRPARRGRRRRRRRPPRCATRPPGCPTGWCRSAASGGGAQRGRRAAARASPRRCSCCPPRPSAAVTAAMDALGLPYAPGHGRAGVVGLRLAGAVGVRRRRASRCPANQAELFAVTTPVAAGRRAARRPRVPRHTASPGSGTSASRWTRRRCSPPTRGPAPSSSGPCRPTRCSASAGRASGSGRRWRRPARPAGALRVECGNTVYPPSYDGARQWGGYPNGLIPPSAMCPLGRGRPLAALRRRRGLPGDVGGVRRAPSGRPICITDSYRTYASQVRLYGAEAGAGRRPGHQQPRLGPGRRPLRRHRDASARRSTPG